MLNIFIDNDTPALLLNGSYNPWLVIASILVAIISSIMGLQIAGMARLAKGRLLHQVALISGSLALGGGIWSMHFIGMLAFELGTHVHYSPAITMLSMVPSVFASWVTLQMLSHNQITRRQLIIGGVMVGSGIGAMHYSGMAAMHLDAILRYDLRWFIASLFVAVALAMLALWIRFGLRTRARLNATQSTLLAGAVMGLAIAGMHYTGMAAARFIGTPDDLFVADNSHNFLAIIIGVITITISLLVLAGNLVLRYRQLYSQMLKIEHELSAREQQYRTLIANIPGVAFRSQANAPWSAIFISDAIATLSGWETEKFYSGEINLGDIVHPDDVERITRDITPALDNKKSYVVEYRIIRRDKAERWVSESASGVYDDDDMLAWIDGVVIDITDSKLRTAEFESVVHAISHAMAVVEFDMDGYITDANDNFLTLTGYELTDLCGQHHSKLCLPEEINNKEYLNFWNNLRQGNFQSGEFLRLGKDGKKIWMQAAYNPIFDADGKPKKVVKLATDLSERKAMETDLMIAKERAEQASSAKGMFLANMSHEIRTPMNAIIGFTELLLNSPLQADQLKHLQTVRRSAGSLLGLLNDILDTAKLERGAVELDLEVFSLKELCLQVIQELQVQADKKLLELIFNYRAGTRDHVLGDAFRLRQILVNLLGNAIKFTLQGTITLDISVDDTLIIFKVIDTGIGIPADRIQHIFTPFTQADASMARRFGGTGLGTTIARQLTELMHGTITVTSVPGEGSCFEVSLPLPLAQATKKITPTKKISLPILRILIADDVPQNIEVLQLMLTRDGHRTITASNGLEAFQHFQQQLFDIVLMDIQMPEVDGLQACKMIRQWELQHARIPTPIVALTASVLEQDRHDAKMAGMNGFASKPINLPELYHEIARCIGILSTPDETESQATNNQRIIDWENALKRWGNRTTLIKAIQRFCVENQQFSLLENLPDISHVHQQAHRIKGAAANLGLAQLVEAASRIEQENPISQESVKIVKTAFADIQQMLTIEHEASPEMYSRHNTHVDVKLLEQLQQAYNHGTFADEAYHKLALLLPTAIIEPLDDALEQFDFDAAAAIVRQWIENGDWVEK